MSQAYQKKRNVVLVTRVEIDGVNAGTVTSARELEFTQHHHAHEMLSEAGPSVIKVIDSHVHMEADKEHRKKRGTRSSTKRAPSSASAGRLK